MTTDLWLDNLHGPPDKSCHKSLSTSVTYNRRPQATVHDLVHANHVLEWAKQWSIAGIRLKFLPLEQDVSVNMLYHAHDHDYRYNKQRERRRRLGLGGIHDSSFA